MPERDTPGDTRGARAGGGVDVTSPMKMPMKMMECDCGFMVRSHNDNEMADMYMTHGKSTHAMNMSRGDAMKMMKPAKM